MSSVHCTTVREYLPEAELTVRLSCLNILGLGTAGHKLARSQAEPTERSHPPLLQTCSRKGVAASTLFVTCCGHTSHLARDGRPLAPCGPLLVMISIQSAQQLL